MLYRRHLLLGGLAGLTCPALSLAEADPKAVALLRRGGVVLAMRHALAPGTFDPPGFSLEQCSSQRNLNDEGRAQARRIGQRMKALALTPARVRSSPWCRCVDTAELAFGQAERWTALGSPRGFNESTNDNHLGQLRQALTQATGQPGRFDVWVTHMFVLSALVGAGANVGEGLVLQTDGRGQVQVLARVDFS